MFPQITAKPDSAKRLLLFVWSLILAALLVGALPSGAATVAAAPLQQQGGSSTATPTPTPAPARTGKRRTSSVSLTTAPPPQPQQAATPKPSPTPATRQRRTSTPAPTTGAAYTPDDSASATIGEDSGEGDGDAGADGDVKSSANANGSGNGSHPTPAVATAAKDSAAKDRAEKERLDKERAESERVEKERVEKERLEKERLAKELEAARADKERLEKERAERDRADNERRSAAEAALEREIERAKATAAEKERAASAAKLEAERKDAAAKLEAERKAADAKLAAERAERERLDKEHADAAAKYEAERKAADAEKARLAAESKAATESAANSERERAKAVASALEQERQQKRLDQIIAVAREMNFVDPFDAKRYVADDAPDVRAALKTAAKAKPDLVKIIVAPAAAFCDQKYVGAPFSLDVPDDIPLEALLTKLRFAYEINFMPDPEILNIPVRVQVQNVPWNKVLRDTLDYADLDASCGIGNTIQLVKRSKLVTIQDNRAKSAPLVEEYIKLKYLQPSSGGLVNVAGKPTGGAKGAYESLEEQLNKLLQQGGDTRGVVSRVPGKNILYISTTEEKMKRIKGLIAASDTRGYQVFVQAAVYTTNVNKLRDVGVQSSLILGNGLGDVLGGITTLPASSNSGGGTGVSGRNPGGIGGLPDGFRSPTNGNGAATPNTVLGLSSIIGTGQFSIQATALAQSGVIKIDSRPATLILDGETGNLNVGRQIPVVVQAINPSQGGLASGQLDVIEAGSVMQVTPQVAEDENGIPTYVTLDLRLESNDADTSITTSGDIPSVVRRAIQTRLRLKTDQTVIIGGFTTDTTSKTRSKTPGLGDLPIIGNLFKRRLDQETRDRLYFAISVRVIPQDDPLVTVEPTLNTNLPAPDSKVLPTQPSSPTAPARKQ